MEYSVKNSEIKIILELTQEEFNTIVCGLGASNFKERSNSANLNNLDNILSSERQHTLYQELKSIAVNI